MLVTNNDVIRGLASWAKMMSHQGQANSSGMPPDQNSKQSGVTNLFLCEPWVGRLNSKEI